MVASKWDYIIVGAGSAGCALAHELARSGERRVLLIESGGSDRSLAIRVPGLIGQIHRRCDWGYVSEPDATREGKTERWQRGHVLGGSSSVNGMIYVRGAPEDYDRWSSLGNPGWSYADVLPIFRDMERSDQPDETRGHSGPVFVRTVRHAHPLTDAFVNAAVGAGCRFNPDYNSGNQEGIAYIQFSQRRGLRWSAADAFVRPIRKMRNFELLLNTRVHRVHIARGRAVGVDVVRAGSSERIMGERVVLCGGALNSPKLLMLSGVGEPAELRALGIPVVARSPAVGRNLQEHSLVRLLYQTRIPSNNLTQGLGQKLRIAGQFLRHRSGPISAAIEAVGFLKTAAELTHPDVQVHFVTLGIASFFGENRSPLLKKPSVTVFVNKSRPSSRGRIRLASADVRDSPRIDCNLLAEESGDLETLTRGVALVRKIMATHPMRGLVETEITPGAELASEGAVMKHIRRNTEVAYHPVGTCRMGSDEHAVVSPELQVNGVENLWVADASVMPDLISGNTNAACMMIGMKLGRQFNSGTKLEGSMYEPAIVAPTVRQFG